MDLIVLFKRFSFSEGKLCLFSCELEAPIFEFMHLSDFDILSPTWGPLALLPILAARLLLSISFTDQARMLFRLGHFDKERCGLLTSHSGIHSVVQSQ